MKSLKDIINNWNEYLNDSFGILSESMDSFIKDPEFKELNGLQTKTTNPWIDVYGNPHKDQDLENDRQNLRSLMKGIKRLWSKHVDRRFIQSLTKVHVVRSVDDFISFANNVHNKKKEISVSLYLKGAPFSDVFYGKNLGFVLDGWISFASNDMDSVVSRAIGHLHAEDRMQKYKPSGIPRYPLKLSDPRYSISHDLIFDEASYNKKEYTTNEAFLKHPKILAIYINESYWNNAEIKYQARKINQISIEHTAPVLNFERKRLYFSEKQGVFVRSNPVRK